jgi:serine-type D-Ala-D-Ala carboxypeptidase (penicillin-binding protein 5/6)
MLLASIGAPVIAAPHAGSDANLADARPQMSASAAIAVDLTTGLELYAVNADTPLQPASTIKIVTALVASSLLDRDAQIVIEEGDLVDPTVFSNMGLLAGDVVTVRDLLAGLLINSAGDAAMALARTGGRTLDPNAVDPVARFVDEMNAYADSIGMGQTDIANPTGADDPERQRATARDLVRATEQLLLDWLLAGFVRTPYVMVSVGGPNARDIELFTTNALLEQADVFGVKTGTEELAGQCLITGFWRGDNQIITVVLGSSDRYADTVAVMQDVDSRFRWVALGQGTRSAGATDALAADGLTFQMRRTIVMRPEDAEVLTWELRPDPAPTYRYGVVAFSVDGREVASIPVY